MKLKDACTALFTIARTWKQPRCPRADKWIRKLWFIYTMEYYSAVKKNTFDTRGGFRSMYGKTNTVL